MGTDYIPIPNEGTRDFSLSAAAEKTMNRRAVRNTECIEELSIKDNNKLSTSYDKTMKNIHLQRVFWNVNRLNNLYNVDVETESKILEGDIMSLCETWYYRNTSSTLPSFLDKYSWLSVKLCCKAIKERVGRVVVYQFS